MIRTSVTHEYAVDVVGGQIGPMVEELAYNSVIAERYPELDPYVCTGKFYEVRSLTWRVCEPDGDDEGYAELLVRARPLTKSGDRDHRKGDTVIVPWFATVTCAMWYPTTAGHSCGGRLEVIDGKWYCDAHADAVRAVQS